MGEGGAELFGDAAVVVSDDGFSECEGFEGDAAEGFGVAGEGVDDGGEGHDFAHVVAVAEEGDGVGGAEGFGELLEFGEEGLFFRVGVADDESVDGESCLAE